MMGFTDPKLLNDYEQAEIYNSSRKEVDGKFIYVSRQLSDVSTP
jgi:hypothetical protein